MQHGAQTEEVLALAVEVLRVLAHATRLQLAWLLLDEELSVTDLAERIGRPVPATSQHLAKMRMARLVNTRRAGTQIWYRIENEHVRQLVIDATRHVEHLASDTPAHHQPLASGPRRLTGPA